MARDSGLRKTVKPGQTNRTALTGANYSGAAGNAA